MIDLHNMEQYQENNRIEAKKAIGGLPKSIWETYSAFANTLGGIILLGVEEYRDKSLHIVDLLEPEALVSEFWELVNDTRQVSVNILSDQNVRIREVDGKRMVVITVPRAQRLDRPVYIAGNPLTGTYRRSGEGDYRCTWEEVQGMLRDAAVQTQDMKLLTGMDLSVFNDETLHRYRAQMWLEHPGHAWEALEDTEFLYKLGAVGRDRDGTLHPTGAGLLMFGDEYEIVREFPNYFLDYREELGPDSGITDRLTSCSGEWSGNLFDFYTLVYQKIVRDIRVPQVLGGPDCTDSPVHRALREALANSVVNADYYGRQGIVIVKQRDQITIANPGAFRIGVAAARSGGVSDPRNAALVKMFNLVNIGRRTGSGIPGIYSVWKAQGWALPVIRETFKPERITLSLAIRRDGEPDRGPRTAAIEVRPLPDREAVIAYLTDRVAADSAELASVLELDRPRMGILLRSMVAEEVIVPVEREGKRLYQLRA